MRISFLIFLLLLPVMSSADELLQRIQEDSFLLQGNVGIVEYSGNRYLISVGFSACPPGNPSLIKKSMVEARATSHSQLSTFIHENEVSVTELSRSGGTSTRNSKHPGRDAQASFNETIQEKNNGPLKMIENLGSWSTGKYLYWVTGIKIPPLSNDVQSPAKVD